MIQIGDTVRYLNSVGGGKVTRIDGKIAYVDDNGFETPFQIKELVVVLPAGHEKPQGAARLMFDQKAFDSGKAPRASESDSGPGQGAGTIQRHHSGSRAPSSGTGDRLRQPPHHSPRIRAIGYKKAF